MAVEPLGEEAIFKVAAELPTAEARSTYLRQVCGHDESLLGRVLALLQASDDDPEFLETPAAVSPPALEIPPNLLGTHIGPYKLREQIGEGGMGVVYVAEQTQPVTRKVALKIIKPGMASKDVVARFEAERQALAMMDHPNIARVFDGGATESGQPYFVMELVQGPSLTEYCDQQRLVCQDRLELFIAVCRAVQHAHQRGVIHRDLKPSNVLVPRIDGAPVPKVIDFGVAKAVGQKLTQQTVYTQFAQMVGTPLYMSPEQAELGVVDVDTRSDVYALGVMLYELLTSKTPFDSDALKQASFDEMRRIIREDEPPKPSAMVSTLNAEGLSTASNMRASDPRTMSNVLKGELDWIVMTALEKDRNRRYQSANAMADDVERYLNEEPVQARPASRWYRTTKFVRRNRTLVASLTLVFIALSLGIAVATVGLLQANRQRDLARQQLEETKAAKAGTDATTDIVWEFLDTEWRRVVKAETITVNEVIVRFEDSFSKRLKDHPEVEIDIRQRLAGRYRHTGEFLKSREHLQHAISLAQAVYGPQSEKIADLYVELVDELQWSRTEVPRDIDACREYIRRALEIYNEHGVRTSKTSHAWYLLSLTLTAATELEKRKECLRKALEIADELPYTDTAKQRVFARLDLTMFSTRTKGENHTAAEQLINEALKILQDGLYPGDQRTLTSNTLAVRAWLHRKQERPVLTITDFQSAWEIYHTDSSLRNELEGHVTALHLAEVLLSAGRVDESDKVVLEIEAVALREALEKSIAETQLFRGWSHTVSRDFATAEADFHAALASAERAYADDHPSTIWCRFRLAESLRRQGKDSAARDHYRRVVNSAQRLSDQGELERASAVELWIYAVSLIYGGENDDRLSEAVEATSQALQKAFAWEQPQLYLASAVAKYKLGDREAAVADLKKGLAAWDKKYPSIHDGRQQIPTSRTELQEKLEHYSNELAQGRAKKLE